MIRSDFEDAKDMKLAAFESDETEIVESIGKFYKKASDAGILAERTYEILRVMIRLEYLTQKSNENANK